MNNRTERKGIVINHSDIKKIIRSFTEHHYPNISDNLDEIGEFLIKHNLSKLTKEEME